MSAPAHGSGPGGGISREMALICSVIQGGHPAFRIAQRYGIEARHLGDPSSDEFQVWRLFESFRLAKEMPSPMDIFHALKVTVSPPSHTLDPDLYSGLVRDWALYQDLSEKLGPIVHRLEVDPIAKRDALKEIIRETNWVVSGASIDDTNNPLSIKEIRDAYERAEALRKSGAISGFSSPWPLWDKRCHGLEDGKFMIVLGKRTGGKTQLTLVWARHIWFHDLKPNENILFVSMEMDPLSVKQRLAAIHTRLDYQKFRHGQLTGPERVRFYKFLDEYEKTPDPTRPKIIFAYSDQIKTVEDIAALAQQHKSRLVIIDGLYILKGKGDTQWERVTDVAKECKLLLCNQLHIPVIATSQFKGTVGNNAEAVDADDAGYAKAIGDYADMMLGVLANDAMKTAKERVIKCLKAREFEPIDWKIRFDMTTMDFSELSIITPS